MVAWHRIMCLALSYGIFLELFGQPPRLQFRHLTPDDGLSSSTVTCFLQDHKGFMWIGTYYGLNRFDGYGFHIYHNQPGDTTSLSHDLVYTLHEDHEKTLWIGTQTGLCRYDRKRDRFINLMQDRRSPLWGLSANVLGIAEDSLHNLWLATDQGAVYYDRKNHRATLYRPDPENPVSLSSLNVESIYIDRHHRVWIGTRQGLNLYDPETRAFRRSPFAPDSARFSEIYVTEILEEKKNILWFGTFGQGLYRLDLTEGTPHWRHFRHRPGNPTGLSGDRVLSLFVDHRGRLWIGVENGGLNLWDPTSERFWHYRKNEFDPNGLNNESIYAIYQDDQENLWVGTFAGGINLTRFNGDAILHYTNLPGAPMSLSHNSVTCFLEDHLGRIWVGTDGGGLNRFLPEMDAFIRYSAKHSHLETKVILAMIESADGALWLGSWGGGLIRFDPEKRRFAGYTTRNSAIQDENIFSIVEDEAGILWLGSFQSGLIRFDPKEGQFTSYTTKTSGLSLNMITVIRALPDGRLLVGTPSGLNLFDPKTMCAQAYFHVPGNEQSLSANGIHDILVANDTTVWVGTDNGLNRFHPVRGTFTHYTTQDGLPDNVIKGIVLDTAQRLWVTTNKGICRLDPENRKAKTYTKADGLQSNEFNDRSAYCLKDGRLLLGGRKGFNLLYPDRIRENHNVPRILITDFFLFNRRVHPGMPDSPLSAHITETDRLVLSYRQSAISFQFTALDFAAPEKNQYAYRLMGFDKEWICCGTQRTAAYTNLNPGKYTFRVKGSNNDGVWNETGASLEIVITPPFWATGWFRILALLCIGGLVVGGYRIRIARIMALNRALDARVRERTRQLEAANREMEAFAYSVSHDLRAPLRAMDGFSEALVEDYGDRLDGPAKEYLARIRGASQQMSRLIDALLSLSRLSRSPMRRERVDLSRLVSVTAEELIRKEPDRKARFEIAEGVIVEGDPSLLRILVWNLMDNAWKFTAKKPETQIAFGVCVQDGERVYFVRDNGIGFDMHYVDRLFEAFQRQHREYDGTGIGLTTVQRIVHRHRGRIWAEGRENEGATFYFTLGRFTDDEEKP